MPTDPTPALLLWVANRLEAFLRKLKAQAAQVQARDARVATLEAQVQALQAELAKIRQTCADWFEDVGRKTERLGNDYGPDNDFGKGLAQAGKNLLWIRNDFAAKLREAGKPLLSEQLEVERTARQQAEQERDSANSRFCEQHRGVWKSSGCVACSVIENGERQRALLEPLEQRAKQAEAALAACRAQQVWQPIETAPKDGTTIYIGVGHIGAEAHWNEKGSYWATSGGFIDHPTHWMPLPTPPQETP